MAETDTDTEKPHEPTQKRLDDARRKGEVPKSVELITAATYAGFLLILVLPGGAGLFAAGDLLTTFLDQPDRLAPLWFDGRAASLSGSMMTSLSGSLAAWALVPAVAALVAVIAQRAMVFAPEKLKPKLNRVSLISNFKNKFGASGLFEFFKSFVKLCAYSIILFFFLYANLDSFISLVELNTVATLKLLASLSIQFLAIALVISLSLGALDFVFQRFNHMQKNRMSRKELTDETKESEGDPHLKQERRQRAYDIATNRMLEDVETADVVVVNPTHYAVALAWSRTPGSAPKCVAKGVDEVAARIRNRAQEHAVPIHSDPPTARALYAVVDIGGEIQPEHYEPVAAAIRFAEAMRAKAKRRI
ncbi:MAG: flagellar type III secretion system protein FlhB [Pseudomonadota bacterium]